MAPETTAATAATGTVLEESWVRDSSLAAPSPPRVRNRRPVPGATSVCEVPGRDRLQAHGWQSTHAGTVVTSRDSAGGWG